MSKKKTQAEQEALLNKDVKSLNENSPAVRALTDDSFPEKSDLEVSEITVALRELLRGQKTIGQELSNLRARMDEYDKASEAFNKDQEKFIQEVFDKAQSLRKTGDEYDKEVAKGVKMFENEIKVARAEHVNARLKFEEELRTMPKVTVTSPGVPEIVMRNGAQTPVLFPETIKIKHKTWTLQPGAPTEVPKIVADRYQQILEMRRENQELQSALGAQMKDTELFKKLREINEKYGAGPDRFPIGSTA